MDPLRGLRENLTAMSKAYGYTLSIWGSGATLITYYQVLSPNTILSFVLGGVLGFSMLAFIAFRGIFKSVEYDVEQRMLVASMVHLIASFGTVLLSNLAVRALKPVVSPLLVFFIIGVHASLSYNVFLLVETYLSEHITLLEGRIVQRVGSEEEEAESF
ncbi:MAG: hypothetical protein SVU32_06835 [Candidatus Nanohaloarchaea archaeon]|nr:hypothetical protein [Candidatus Nanohaloarchaea archaeon]